MTTVTLKMEYNQPVRGHGEEKRKNSKMWVQGCAYVKPVDYFPVALPMELDGYLSKDEFFEIMAECNAKMEPVRELTRPGPVGWCCNIWGLGCCICTLGLSLLCVAPYTCVMKLRQDRAMPVAVENVCNFLSEKNALYEDRGLQFRFVEDYRYVTTATAGGGDNMITTVYYDFKITVAISPKAKIG